MCVPMMGMLGGVISGLGSMMAAQGQADQMERQAQAYERQAQIERQTAEYEAERERDKGKVLLGRQIAGYHDSGISTAPGETASEIIIDSARENELDVEAIKYGGRVKRDNFMTQASISRANAANTRTAGMISGLAPIIGGFKPSGGGSTNFGFGGGGFSFGFDT